MHKIQSVINESRNILYDLNLQNQSQVTGNISNRSQVAESVTGKIYVDEPTTVAQLKDNIKTEIDELFGTVWETPWQWYL